MTEQRPRPQYGEYASDEDQAKAAGKDAAAPAETEHGASPLAPPPAPATTANAKPTSAAAVASRRSWDLLLSVMLLVIGALNVVSYYASPLDLSALIQQVYDQFDGGRFTAIDLARSVALWFGVAQFVIFAITALLTILALRRGRLAFYIPLAGAVVFLIAGTVLVSIAMGADPPVVA